MAVFLRILLTFGIKTTTQLMV